MHRAVLAAAHNDLAGHVLVRVQTVVGMPPTSHLPALHRTEEPVAAERVGSHWRSLSIADVDDVVDLREVHVVSQDEAVAGFTRQMQTTQHSVHGVSAAERLPFVVGVHDFELWEVCLAVNQSQQQWSQQQVQQEGLHASLKKQTNKLKFENILKSAVTINDNIKTLKLNTHTRVVL